jgi:hypothetical protein
MMINDHIDEPKTLYIPDKHVWRRGVVLCYAGTLSSRPHTTDKPGGRGFALGHRYFSLKYVNTAYDHLILIITEYDAHRLVITPLSSTPVIPSSYLGYSSPFCFTINYNHLTFKAM